MDISKLLDIMTALRRPTTGCPWDLEQDFESIAPHTIEEAYEVADAIERHRYEALPDELGDLLFQVVFHAQLGSEAGYFDFGDVVTRICEKLVRRHPHVFGTAAVESAAQQTEQWESHKRLERLAVGQQRVLDDVPANLPALSRARKLGGRAARVGFDWPTVDGVRDKVDEELGELDAALADGEADRVAAELGDLLFAVVNLCRRVDVDPEQALRGANRRFELRFADVEDSVARSGRGWDRHSLDELDRYWCDAKARERANRT